MDLYAVDLITRALLRSATNSGCSSTGAKRKLGATQETNKITRLYIVKLSKPVQGYQYFSRGISESAEDLKRVSRLVAGS